MTFTIYLLHVYSAAYTPIQFKCTNTYIHSTY